MKWNEIIDLRIERPIVGSKSSEHIIFSQLSMLLFKRKKQTNKLFRNDRKLWYDLCEELYCLKSNVVSFAVHFKDV